MEEVTTPWYQNLTQSSWFQGGLFSVGGALAIGIIVLVLYLLGFFGGSKPNSENKASKIFSAYGQVEALTPMVCPTGDDTRLCDYYIASSAYSVFPSSKVNDYVSDQVVAMCIKAGARLVELDVYDDGNGAPVVGLKNEAIGYDYAKNSVSFDSCCVAVANTAFNATATPVYTDPFILSIVFHTQNRSVMDAAANVLKTTLGTYLLDSSYSYQRKNLAQEPICNLAGKCVIVSGGQMKGTDMEELVNLSWSTSHLRRLTYMQASQPYDHEELINHNRQHITMVIPDPDPDLKNSSPTILFAYGCQWNLMNYGSIDPQMELYVGTFQQGSVIVKPEPLRFTPTTYQSPTPQTPDKSFQPMAQSSPIYDPNPQTGDNSIVI